MKRPDAGDTIYPEDDVPTEEVAVSVEAAAWLAEELADLRERLVVMEAGQGRDRAVLVLRADLRDHGADRLDPGGLCGPRWGDLRAAGVGGPGPGG
jgi:hypothetical protein